MLDLTWTKALSADALSLSDAIELMVAFDAETFAGRFTRADYIQWVSMEELNSREQDYLDGDDIDDHNSKFEQAIVVMRNRAEWLVNQYPFEVGDDEVSIDESLVRESGVPYLLLLVCANGNAFPGWRHELPVQFEHLCKEAFEVLFPPWAEVLLFSKDSEDRKRLFGSKASEALPVLARKLNARVRDDVTLPDTQREFGIDLMAICSLEDEAPYPPFAFAQCTIQEEWWEKRHEASAENELAGFLDVNVKHHNYLMIPHFPRYSLVRWSEDGGRTGNCILCDRLRICRLLRRSDFLRGRQVAGPISALLRKLEEHMGVAPG